MQTKVMEINSGSDVGKRMSGKFSYLMTHFKGEPELELTVVFMLSDQTVTKAIPRYNVMI